jgi:uncharacterized protein with PIN domain
MKRETKTALQTLIERLDSRRETASTKAARRYRTGSRANAKFYDGETRAYHHAILEVERLLKNGNGLEEK